MIGLSKQKNKLIARVIEGELRERNELRRKRAELPEVKRRIFYAPILDKINGIEKKLLRKNEKANELLKEAIVKHNLLAESLW